MEEIIIIVTMENIIVINTGSEKGFLYSKMLVKIGYIEVFCGVL